MEEALARVQQDLATLRAETQQEIANLNAVNNQLNEQMVQHANLIGGWHSTTPQIAEAIRLSSEAVARLTQLVDQGFGKKEEMVDSKGIGQPFKYSGSERQDFAEWSSKTMTFLKARLGHQVEEHLKWAQNQRVPISKDAEEDDPKRAAWPETFKLAPGSNKIAADIYVYLQGFTTSNAWTVVKNTKGDDGLEAWRRLVREYDPTSPVRRVVARCRTRRRLRK